MAGSDVGVMGCDRGMVFPSRDCPSPGFLATLGIRPLPASRGEVKTRLVEIQCAISSPMSPASVSAMPMTRGWRPAPPPSFSTNPRSPPSTCAAARREHARPTCSIRIARSNGSTPWCCPAARPSASMPQPACKPGFASRAAASRSATSASRSRPVRSCSICSTAATKPGDAFRPIAISDTRLPRPPPTRSRSAPPVRDTARPRSISKAGSARRRR